MNNLPGPPRWIRILVLLASLGVAIFLVWYNYQRGVRFRNGGLLTGLLFLMLFILTSAGILQFPRGFNIPFFEVRPTPSDLAKALAFFFLIFLWTPLVKQLVPDTPVGALL
ncbi:MAG TPA: hypothetical protein VFW40_09960, partial [Capsulimonadaceae bacterium]|nr:hypothetical protein [Capsulimonadaceae bacterium]